jgi:threonine dehydrogenase-like Zn-dependent dehydrogenase
VAEKVLASTLIAPKQFEIREYDMPEIPADGGLLRVERCGVCGSDVSGWSRLAGGPKIMGHENVGFIAKLGRDAAQRWGVKEGDRVAVEEYVPCGSCKVCRSGEFRFCAQTSFAGPAADGRPRYWYGSTPVSVAPALWGGYSQYMYLHPGAMIHKVPAHVPPSEIAFFLPFSNGIEWALNYGGITPGKTIVIQGPGQQGLACVLAAKIVGAACVIVSGLGRDEERLAMARRLGADYAVNVEGENLEERVNEITGGEGVDAVINVTGGGEATVREGMAMAGLNGTVVLAAAGDRPISTGGGGRKNLTLKWAHGHSYQSVELAIQYIASGEFPIAELTKHHFGLNDVAMAIKSIAGEGVPGAIHVSVDPWEGA